MTRGILWDFDGTLAYRPREWRGALIEVLDEYEPGHGVDLEAIRPFLREGFPWHTPLEPHLHLSEPEAWWESVGKVIARAFAAAGLSASRSAELALMVRERYTDASRGWRVADGAEETLDRLSAAGCQHAILSNHVPELPRIVAALGLLDHFQAVLTSAAIGYEKPHPEAFAIGRRALGESDELWMVGDNPDADVAGAEAVGIRGLLVQHPDSATQPGAVRLAEVPDLLGAGDGL